MSSDYIVVLITCSSEEEANRIKDAMLKEKKAACVNIISSVQSFFWWKNKVDTATEVLLLAKTKRDLFKEIVILVKKIHSYEVCEIIALSIIEGNVKYLEWIEKEVSQTGG